MYSYRKLDDPRQVLPIAKSAFAFRQAEHGCAEDWLNASLKLKRELYGVYGGDTLLSAFMLYDFDMRLRNSVVPMGGIGLLCSRLDARSQGSVRAMLAGALQTMKDGSHIVSVLDPFNESFYRKYGWEKFSRRQNIELAPGNLSIPESSDSSILATDLPFPDDDSMNFYNNYAAQHYTLAQRSPQQWNQRLKIFAWSEDVAARGVVRFSQDEHIVGLMEYELMRKAADYHSSFIVTLMATEDAAAFREMLRYIKRLAHQVSTIRLSLPLNITLWPYLSDRPKQRTVRDEFMIRIVNMASLDGLAMEMPDVCVAVDVADGQASWNEGAWLLQVDSGILRVKRGEQADLRCGIGALSSVLSGFSTFEEMISANLADPLETYDGQDFPKTTPFLADHF